MKRKLLKTRAVYNWQRERKLFREIAELFLTCHPAFMGKNPGFIDFQITITPQGQCAKPTMLHIKRSFAIL